MKIKKWRVCVNRAWTTEIVSDKLFYFKKNAKKEFNKLRKLYFKDKEFVVSLLQ